MHNGGCVEKETNYHFNYVIRLGKLPFVLFAQIMSFSGSCDMNSPLEKLVREVIKMPLGLNFALCVSTNIVLFSIAGPFAGLQ